VTTEAEVRAAFAELLPRRTSAAPAPILGLGLEDFSEARDYLARAAAEGWVVPRWPKEYGGRDASDDEAELISRVQQEFEVPDLYAYSVGLRLLGPCLLVHGTEEQKARWLPQAANGAEIWCQLFSEPDAGSDLANVRTRAVSDNGTWKLDGQKVWTSRATWAKWGLCLARTDPDVPKHKGMTMFAIDMEQPGVDIRPLKQMNGDEHFSEVFLQAAEVPDANRIGDLGAGWSVTRSVLAAEQGVAGHVGAQEVSWATPEWLVDLDARGVLGDPVWLDRAMRAYCLEQTARLASARRSTGESSDGMPDSRGSGAKLREDARYKAVAYLVKDSYGAAGLLQGHDGHLEFLTAPSMSIRGGTDEIQRNIVGERSLRLPPEPRGEKDLPWSATPKTQIPESKA
jgi:alkylation response protein AidB-like acyl-CoA dehydrogenase